MPLLFPDTSAKLKQIMSESKKEKLSRVSISDDKTSVKVIKPQPEEMQLPIERIAPFEDVLYNKEVCVFCEYFLHYIQQAISLPSTEVCIFTY